MVWAFRMVNCGKVTRKSVVDDKGYLLRFVMQTQVSATSSDKSHLW